jgi:hypothetical protein
MLRGGNQAAVMARSDPGYLQGQIKKFVLVPKSWSTWLDRM